MRERDRVLKERQIERWKRVQAGAAMLGQRVGQRKGEAGGMS